MNKDEKLNILKRENPFTSSSVGDPWEERYPDVESVNKLAFEQITQLIDQKTENPAHPCAGLVFGEVGSGKTHLISRILKYGRQAKFPFSFAYIQPIEDPEQTYRYFLREVMINLCYPIDKSSNTNQLDIILEKSFKEVIEKFYPKTPVRKADQFLFEFRRDPFHFFRQKKINLGLFRDLGKMVKEIIQSKKIEKKVIESMRVKFSDLPKEFLRVLFQYQYPEKRTAAMEWLKGVTIDEEDAALLKVVNRLNDSPAMLEQKSRNILSYMGTLLAYYKLPLVICFDRLENYDTDAKIRSMGKIIEFLVDKAKAMLPVVFVRGQQWDEKIIKKLNQQVITRLKTNEFKLKGCDCDQSPEIIRTRLASVLGEDNSDPFFPFDKEELTNIFKTRLHSPRQVIILANQRLKQILYPDRTPKPVRAESVHAPIASIPEADAPVPLESVQYLSDVETQSSHAVEVQDSSAVGVQDSHAVDKLQEEFEKQLHIISNDFNRYQPDRSRLNRSLELYLNHALPESSSVHIESLIHPEDKYLDFECKLRYQNADSSVQAIFIIDIESNSPAIRASISRGVDFLEKFPDGKVIYIRDSRYAIPPPPQWKATNDMLGSLRELGGNIIFLNEEQAAQWYALALLNYAVKEGDITMIDADNTRSLSSEELALFVKEKIRDYEGFQVLGFKTQQIGNL